MRISGVTYAARRTHKARKVFLTLFVLLLVLILATVVISTYQGWNLLHPERKGLDTFSSNIAPEYRDVSFRSSDKTTVLDGWYFQAGNSTKTVVLAHSQGKNRLEFGLETVEMIKQFLDKGYNVLAFDFRNSGTSEGKISTFGSFEKNDLIGAINYVRQQGAKHVVLVGFSTGASASLMAASESGKVDAVVADSPYSSLKDYMRESLNNLTGLPQIPFNEATLLSIEVIGGFETANVSPLNELSRLNKSTGILLIHGKDDSVVPVQNSKDLYSAAKSNNIGNVELWLTADSGNATSYLSETAEYMTKVFAFLDKIYAK